MSAPAAVASVPVERLRTSLAALRGSGNVPADPLAALPLRVVAWPDGSYEVVDGFKRLERWRREGATSIPVVLEIAPTARERKLLLLRANAPPRTLTPLDEARVIDTLVREDGLTLEATARLLGRRTSWVARRHALVTRLAPALQEQLDRRTLRPSLAYALVVLPAVDQLTLFRAIERHGLKDREGMTLVATWRASSATERQGLLADPWPALSRCL